MKMVRGHLRNEWLAQLLQGLTYVVVRLGLYGVTVAHIEVEYTAAGQWEARVDLLAKLTESDELMLNELFDLWGPAFIGEEFGA